jgi:Sugar phosphate isomerases/epimerases
MKLSFSTIGCPDWSWNDITSAARDLGYDGVEMRGVGNELYAPKAKPFLAANINKTMENLKKQSLSICCLTSGCLLNDSNVDKNMEEARDYIDLAATIGVQYVRVLGDTNPQPGDISLGFVTDNLRKVVAYASSKNVTVLVETNGVFADSRKMSELIESINSDNLGVLWDVHHTCRYFNESPAETYELLGKYIKHVHVKDSKVSDGKIVYKMLGYGDIPVCEAVEVLQKGGYNGFISLEWVKRWCLELEEPGIVFAHFINQMKNC